MLNLNAMAVFSQVVQSGSFSAAAKHLAMPLSTVSRRVSDLEASLNVKLLERSTRSLRLTDIGAIYFEHCRRGLEEFKTAQFLVEERQAEVSGTLYISLPPSLAESLFVPIIALFQKRYPKANVFVFITERITDRIDDGVDISFRVGPIADSSLISRKLLTYRHMLVATPTYLSEFGHPNSPQELIEHRLIAFGFWREAVKRWAMSCGNKTQTVTFKPNVSFNDYSAIQRAVILHQGIAEIPFILCDGALRQNNMVEVLPKWRFQDISLRAVYVGTKNMSRLVRLFLDTCAEHIEAYVIPDR